MTEKLKKRVQLALLTLIPPIVSGVVANLEAKMEARSSARWQANDKTEALLQGMRPAIEELRNLAEQRVVWEAAVTKELETLQEEIGNLKDKTSYLEGYVEAKSRTKYKPPVRDKPTPTKLPVASKKPRAPLPQSVGKVKDFKEARKKMRCDDDDPFCAVEALAE